MPIQPPEIPQILKKRLVFGDPEQISALQKYEAEVNNSLDDGCQKEFRVFIEVQYSETVMVKANSRREAEAKAKDSFDIFGLDYEISFHAVEG
jgi:hypothetical protein